VFVLTINTETHTEKDAGKMFNLYDTNV